VIQFVLGRAGVWGAVLIAIIAAVQPVEHRVDAIKLIVMAALLFAAAVPMARDGARRMGWRR
jgi:hypothetical protein